MPQDVIDPASKLLDAGGQQARRASSKMCPCGAGPEHHVPSNGGFGGAPHPVCGKCGYDFHGERME